MDTGIHVLINFFSTILLAGSNYCMQILSAPKREQIDGAHRESRWVEVGVQSVRNVFRAISSGNALLWILLSLSSLPLHLSYNSAIFTSISINEYSVTVVPSSFITLHDRSALPAEFRTPRLTALHDAALSGRLVRLDHDACLDAYAANFQSSYSDLLLVTPDPHADEPMSSPIQHQAFAFQDGCGIRQSYQWMCSQQEDEVFAFECYALPTEERCRLLFSPTLRWAVTGLNLVKGVLMLATALRSGEGQQGLVLTVGDAVVSFTRVPDEATVDMCLASKDEVEKGTKTGRWSREPRTVDTWHRLKFAAANPSRWAVCVVFKTVMQLDQMGDGFNNLLGNIIIANSPQAIASMLYFIYNGLFTAISLATEWDTCASHRKGLRVSSTPVGAQRTAYFLQLPFQYSLPLLAISGVLHWLISQSIFLIFVEVYRDWVPDSGAGAGADRDGGVPVLDYTTCGWSPAGLVSVIVVGIAMIVFLLASGARRLSPYMPVAGSRSAAIAAACHLVPYKKMACEEPLQLGATIHEGDGRGLCSFSSGEAEPPIQGMMYR
ncbi:hypothetical protein VTG60DRAFT_1902 [Thermothelomyces hinnuleus]